MANKRFKSITGADVQVALMTGHIAVVGTDWTELEPRFHREAYALGCISEGMADPTEEEAIENAAPNFDRAEAIKNAIVAMIESGNKDDFTAQGVPSVDAISERVGFKVSRDERDTSWDEIQKALAE